MTQMPAPAMVADPYAGLRTPRHKLERGLARYVASKRTWARNRRPIISLTFDDIPESAFTNGAAVLESQGVRGTFYIAGGLCGTAFAGQKFISRSGCIALHQKGHEIGCHTFSHPIVQTLGAKEFAAELEYNKQFFSSLASDLTLDSFCFPYGLTSLSRKRQAQARFKSCRGSRKGINVGQIDLGMLKSVPIDQTLSIEDIKGLIEEAVRLNGWLIFFTHDVQPRPSWIGCSPDLLDATVEIALRLGCEVLTVRAALSRLQP